MDFSKRLKKLRTEKDISQEDLARLLNISRTSVTNYELGRNEASAQILNKLSEIFHCSIDYLLGKTDIRNSGEQIDDVLNEAMIGMSKKDYEKLTETQKKQIRDFAIFVKNQNETDKK